MEPHLLYTTYYTTTPYHTTLKHLPDKPPRFTWGHHAPGLVTGGPQQGHQPPAGGHFKDLSRSIPPCFFALLVGMAFDVDFKVSKSHKKRGLGEFEPRAPPSPNPCMRFWPSKTNHPTQAIPGTSAWAWRTNKIRKYFRDNCDSLIICDSCGAVNWPKVRSKEWWVIQPSFYRHPAQRNKQAAPWCRCVLS